MNSIDRFEEENAVIETDSGYICVPRSSLPPDAREGDLVEQTGSGWITDSIGTLCRKRLLAAKRNRLSEDHL